MAKKPTQFSIKTGMPKTAKSRKRKAGLNKKISITIWSMLYNMQKTIYNSDFPKERLPSYCIQYLPDGRVIIEITNDKNIFIRCIFINKQQIVEKNGTILLDMLGNIVYFCDKELPECRCSIFFYDGKYKIYVSAPVDGRKRLLIYCEIPPAKATISRYLEMLSRALKVVLVDNKLSQNLGITYCLTIRNGLLEIRVKNSNKEKCCGVSTEICEIVDNYRKEFPNSQLRGISKSTGFEWTEFDAFCGCVRVEVPITEICRN